MPLLLPIHIAAGGLAIVLGFTALAARKGGWIHRRFGIAFVFAMLTMGVSASILAVRKSWTDPNIVAAFMTAYFVVTGLTAVRAATPRLRWLNIGALLIAVGLAVLEWTNGAIVWGLPRHALNGVPALMLMFLGTILTLAAIGDIRVLRSGPPRGAKRLSRHLWRMCFALFIAAGSFFSISSCVAKIFPREIADSSVRMLPIPLIFAVMFFWFWRLRGKRPIPQRG